MSEIESLLNQVIYQAFRIGYANAKNSGSDFSRGDNIPIRSKADLLSAIKNRIKGGKGDSGQPKHSHYHKDVSDYDTIDIYVICDLYVNDNSGCIQHAVKKLLCCGNRGVKNNVKDLQEAIDTIQRKIEILQGKSE